MSTDTTPERRLTDEERHTAIEHSPNGTYGEGLEAVADAQLAKADAWWRKREVKLVRAFRVALWYAKTAGYNVAPEEKVLAELGETP